MIEPIRNSRFFLFVNFQQHLLLAPHCMPATISKKNTGRDIWNYFEKDVPVNLGKCKHYPNTYDLEKTKKSHSSLWYHIEHKHTCLLLTGST